MYAICCTQSTREKEYQVYIVCEWFAHIYNLFINHKNVWMNEMINTFY